MNNDYAWAPATDPISDPPAPVHEAAYDIVSVAHLWVSTAYDDLRRAGPDRAAQVRWILDRYLIPWFAPQTNSVGDITYYMVHAWLLRLVGRQHTESADTQPSEHPAADLGAHDRNREVSLRQAAQAAGVSISTARRRWHDGELPGAYRDLNGQIRVSGQTTAALAARTRPRGLSRTVIADALWVLRQVLGFARATGIVPPGFDPTEGLTAPTPDAATARARRLTSTPRPLSLPECARIATHLHPVHQMVLWLQRVMGLRISEAFGLLVDDVIDHGDSGLLLVRGQGGRDFQVRDDDGRVITVPHKERTKTEAGTRVLVIPTSMLVLLRVAIEAFHTDPDTGDAEETSRLVPGLRVADEAGQVGFRMAFENAATAEGLSSRDLGFHVSPHLLRKSVATDIAWHPGIDDAVRRRFMGHRAADDVYGRIYTLDHPELTPLAEVARVLDTMIRDAIGTLLVPTARRIRWAHSNPHHDRAAHISATLDAAGWSVEPDSADDPLCDTQRVASELRIAETTARRWMRDGTLRCVTTHDGNAAPRRQARLSDVWSLRDRLVDHILLPDLAVELEVRYHDLYRTVRRLGLELQQHRTNRQFEVPPEAAERLRHEHSRIRALHERSLKLAAAARQLDLAVSTVNLMINRCELDLDPETDSSGARFVSRASVERSRIAREGTSRKRNPGPATVPLVDVVRFTGRSRTELTDLIRAGILEQVPGRRTCELTAASLQKWVTATA